MSVVMFHVVRMHAVWL